ncbi:hypothetical protein EG68_08345 [Paragonimus skrjabini miyazakii]|uniref:WW domain-binding protein 4 n=1 Tax=Paragonimus skrjabini miyazakii TaxID=59628 RepID=A0A8S9YHM3_9TREM|nr:hypothetical protein EG68_08345 [Paragonimus skrjabini miyazakii]
MADYWKSNPRKYCEVCKCWMADNKISVQNHENGMRHKANVDKKMNELQRNNKNAERDEQNLRSNLQQINDAAFVGMMKDLARDPALAKRYGVVLTDHAQEEVMEKVSGLTGKPKSEPAPGKKAVVKTAVCEWHEATAADGRKYYWNAITRATQWERPPGLIAQEVVSVREEKNRLQQFVLSRLVELSESGSESATAAVHKAFNADEPEPEIAREEKSELLKMAKKRKKSEAESHSLSRSYNGPKIDLLGQWVTVNDTPPKLPKLGLPGEHVDLSSNFSKELSSQTEPKDEIDPRFAVLAHLEETTEANIQSARQLETSEKQLVPGLLSGSKETVVKPEKERSLPKLIFRRGPSSSSSRNFRTAASDD